MKTTDDLWVDVSYTVKASTLNGGSLMRNTRTGEEKVVTDEDVLDFGQLALNFDEPPTDEPVLPAFFDTPPPMETLSDKAVKILTARLKPKAKVKK